MCTFVCRYTYLHICLCVHARVCIYKYICGCILTYVHTYIHSYIQTYTPPPPPRDGVEIDKEELSAFYLLSAREDWLASVRKASQERWKGQRKQIYGNRSNRFHTESQLRETEVSRSKHTMEREEQARPIGNVEIEKHGQSETARNRVDTSMRQMCSPSEMASEAENEEQRARTGIKNVGHPSILFKRLSEHACRRDSRI